jgi:cytoskeletal protein RodZ
MAEDFEVGGPLPEESSNRTFLIAAAGIGGLLVLSMICLGVYALVLAPRQQQARVEQATQIVLQNTQVAQSLTQTAAAGRATQTPTPSETPVPNTPTATATQVVVIPTDTPFTTFGTSAPLTATAAAQQTLDAAQQTTPTATPTALPATGFADEAGLPTLFLLALGLLAVVIVARGIRTRTS